MNKILIIISVVVIVLSLILYKSVSVFELMVNDAKNKPEKFEKFLNNDQKKMIETLNELEEELAEKEEELAKHMAEEEERKRSSEESEQAKLEENSGRQDPETEEEVYQSFMEKSEQENSEEKSSRKESVSFNASLSVDMKEGFENIIHSCPQAIFSSPCPVNTPVNDEAIPETYTGGNYNSYKPLNPVEGNYCLPIQKLQYDGIWNNNVVQLGNGYQTNNWSLSPNQPIVQSQYCANTFINIPENVLIPGTRTHSETVNDTNYVIQCY